MLKGRLHVINSFYESICKFEGTDALILGSFFHFWKSEQMYIQDWGPAFSFPQPTYIICIKFLKLRAKMCDESCRQYSMTVIFLIVTCKIYNSFGDFFSCCLCLVNKSKYLSCEWDLKGLSYDFPFGFIIFRDGMYYMWRLFSLFTLTGMTARN